MRIIAGEWRGRKLQAPQGDTTRPTSDRARETLFSMLASRLGSFEGLDVLDCFAGTGALGLEAISRGARRCDFVETRPTSLSALKSNIIKLKLRERTRVFKKDALPFAAALDEGAYDLVFVDPPYGSRMLDRVIASWQEKRFTPTLVCEHERSHSLPNGAKRLDFGETVVSIYRLPGTGPGTARPARPTPAPPPAG